MPATRRKPVKRPQTTAQEKIPYFLLGIIVGVLLVAGFFVGKKYLRMLSPVKDSPYTEQHHLPRSLKKKLVTVTPTTAVRIPILMYHYVEYVADKNDKTRQLLNTPPDVFEAQLKALQGAGYTFLTAKEVGEILDGKRSLPTKPIVLTFDDGHWDFYTNVLPLLKKYHIKATAYIITGFLDGSDFMSKAQVKAVVQSQLVDVGAHTVHHLALKGLPLATVEYEIKESKRWLENQYHVPVASFAYPDGSFDEQAAEVVEKAGFTTGVSTIPGIEQTPNNRYFLYRLRPGNRTGQELLHWLGQETFTPYE